MLYESFNFIHSQKKYFTMLSIKWNITFRKKFVIDDTVHIVKCPLVLLEIATFTDHFIYLIQETLEAHHQQFGCSVTSLVAMWYFWNKEIHSITLEGIGISDVVNHSHRILDYAISFLSKISIDVKRLIFTKNDKDMDKMNVNKSISNPVPIGVRFSSRHYSPFQLNLEQLETENIVKNINEDILLRNVETNEELKSKIYSVVQKLSHDDPDCSQIVCDLWVRQISANRDFKFCKENIIIFPVTYSSSYTSVIDGLVIKSKLLSQCDFKISVETKVLVIKGSITFEYVHLGYNSKIPVIKKLTPDEINIQEKDSWLKKCCDLLIELQVNTLLVHGIVDTDIAIFCSTHSILLLSEIPWSTFEIICASVKIVPCTYLLDCNKRDVISNIKVKKWNLGCDETNSAICEYFCIDIEPVTELIKPCSVILCHPNPANLFCIEHQLKHLMSRLSLASEPNSFLPGCGETEKCIFNHLKSFASKTSTEAKICSAIARGFHNYSELVSKKMELKENTSLDDTLDEMQSKMQAWKAALSLTILTIQCDLLIVNEFSELVVKEFPQNVMGNL